MTQKQQRVNPVSLNPLTANLVNVSLAVEVAEIAMGRGSTDQPGMVCFTGFSGLGKSKAGAYVAQQYRGFYVEFREDWDKETFVDAIRLVMGLRSEKKLKLTAAIDTIIDELSVCGRPLIIDEFDQLVDRKYLAKELLFIILNIAKRSSGSIILIGEEMLPHKLAKVEKFHNCILDWKQAVTTDINDCRILARHYYPHLEIRDDLLTEVVKACNGIARRIGVNLLAISIEAAALGLTSIGLSEWGKKTFNTGAPPKIRSLK